MVLWSAQCTHTHHTMVIVPCPQCHPTRGCGRWTQLWRVTCERAPSLSKNGVAPCMSGGTTSQQPFSLSTSTPSGQR